MSSDSGKEKIKDPTAIHEFYMSILNGIPNGIYWIDINCQLQGCNQAFVQLLGLDDIKDFKNTPYYQMKDIAHWPDKWVERFKLDDMQVIFSGKAQYNQEEPALEDSNGKKIYFQSTRIPVYDHAKNITGLIVTLTDISSQKASQNELNTKPVNEVSSNDIAYDGHLPNILMIEDNLIAQCVEKALLTSLNCQVDIAESEANAIKLFDPGKYDLVLMDIGLEETSGYAVAKKLRQIEKDTEYHVPIVALTGYDADVVKVDCQKYMMEGAITKPLTSQQAEQLIQHYVYHLDIPVNGLKQN